VTFLPYFRISPRHFPGHLWIPQLFRISIFSSKMATPNNVQHTLPRRHVVGKTNFAEDRNDRLNNDSGGWLQEKITLGLYDSAEDHCGYGFDCHGIHRCDLYRWRRYDDDTVQRRNPPEHAFNTVANDQQPACKTWPVCTNGNNFVNTVNASWWGTAINVADLLLSHWWVAHLKLLLMLYDPLSL